jgi:hypothetical protein
VRPQVLNFHPPFCPVYVLHSGLQGGGKRPNKWVRRSGLAIYLGSSPHHARSVSLILSLDTRYVSPQFHLKFDDFFETVQDATILPQSKWQQLACFEASSTLKDQPSQVRKRNLSVYLRLWMPFQYLPLSQLWPREPKMTTIHCKSMLVI